MSRAKLVMTVLSLLAAETVHAATPVAVFPFQMQDTSGEGGSPAQAARLTAATAELADALRKTGRYTPVDLSAYASQIAALQSPDECGECWAKLARQAGARLEVLPNVHKVSTLISVMAIWFADVDTMKYTAHIDGQIRGDTQEAYARGIHFLIGEELVAKGHAP